MFRLLSGFGAVSGAGRKVNGGIDVFSRCLVYYRSLAPNPGQVVKFMAGFMVFDVFRNLAGLDGDSKKWR